MDTFRQAEVISCGPFTPEPEEAAKTQDRSGKGWTVSLDLNRLVTQQAQARIQQRQLTHEEQEQIQALYRQQRHGLLRYLRSMRMPKDRAEEVVQETFLRLAMELLARRKIENVPGWIVRVVHNLAMDAFKAMGRDETKYREVTNDDEQTWIDPKASPEDAYSEKEKVRCMNTVLSGLTSQYRQCFQMRAQGIRYKDIGEAIGISEQRAAFIVKQVAVRLAVAYRQENREQEYPTNS